MNPVVHVVSIPLKTAFSDCHLCTSSLPKIFFPSILSELQVTFLQVCCL